MPKEVKKSLRLSGLFLRRKPDKEFHSYIPMLDYSADDYEVLLRVWGSEPFPGHLGAFSGPMIVGEDPEETLLTKSCDWTKNLANKVEITNYKPLKGQKAVFMSMHGGEHRDHVSGVEASIGTVLCYVVPIKQSDSSLISRFPDSPQYPKFYSLGTILHQMARSSIKIHPYTREMLATLDHWLREQHAISGGVNSLFAPSLQSRMKMFVQNPLHTSTPAAPPVLDTPNQSFATPPLTTSTPYTAPRANVDSTGQDSTDFAVSKVKESDLTATQHQPVDMIVENPIFGSGLRLRKVDMVVANDYFGHGEPNYSALKGNKGKWTVQVQGDGLPDWTELFPLHKFCCEGNVSGVRKCIKVGVSADERDTDTWSPLHYACWYGELEVVKVLVEEASAAIGIQNSCGSTPLHLAAGTGHAAVVSYLLSHQAGQGVKAALDNEGKSPLAVCLDSKMNDWEKTAEILRDAYNHPTPADLSFPPPLLPYSPPTSSMEDLSAKMSDKTYELDLDLKGSLRNLYNAKHAKKSKEKSKSQSAKPAKSIRRLRVNLGIGRHQVAHFYNGRETDCKDIVTNLYKLIKLPKNFHNVFALWIASDSLELQLGDGDQPLKLIYTWKKLLSKYTKGEAELPTLHLWRNVFYPPSAEQKINDPMVLEFLYTEAHRHVIRSQYPCSEDDVLYLAGITLQITYGDYNEALHGAGFLRDKLNKVLPSHMIASRRKLEYERKVLAKYSEICQYGFEDLKFLYHTYLKHCWQWPYYAATFYEGTLHMKDAKLEIKSRITRKSQLPIHLGINTNGFHVVNLESNTLITSLQFDGLDWDVSTAKQEMVIFNADKSIYIPVHSRKVSLLYSLATRMREQYTVAT